MTQNQKITARIRSALDAIDRLNASLGALHELGVFALIDNRYCDGRSSSYPAPYRPVEIQLHYRGNPQ